MPLFLLVRHGENNFVKKGRLAGRLPGVHLNEKGIAQAQAVADALAQRLKETPVKAVYSSPMERAMETAVPIGKALGLEVIPRPGLIEVDIGDWQNKTVKGLSRLKVWRVVQRTPSLFQFPNGESFAHAQHRICDEIQALMQQHDPKDILICVSHADPIKLAVSYYIGQPLDLFQRLSVAPASITTLYVGEMGSNLMALNVDLAFDFAK
ncbi:MAG: histidine phosphatase family protein [Omnitrophica WOR_2 bacterium]